MALRQTFNLYANLRPIKNLPGVKARYQGIDLIVVRENTEGLYSGIEHEVIPGVVESLKIMTEKACTKISKFAFDFARRNGRKKVAAVHKANIMKMSDGLFLDCARKVAASYKTIGFSDVIVDNACLQLVINPWQFDVLLMENLYGDILSDLAAGLVGGLGVVPGANLGDNHALFEAVHGSAPDIKGKNIANPSAMIQAASRSGVGAIFDLAQAFRSVAAAGGPLFYRFDGAHWTPRAHRLAGDAIAEWILAGAR